MEPYIDTARLLYGPHDGASVNFGAPPRNNECVVLLGETFDSLYCFSEKLQALIYVRRVAKVKVRTE